jgi:hypothetical protein
VVTDPRNRRGPALAHTCSLPSILPGINIWTTELVPSTSVQRERLRRACPTLIVTIQGTMPPTQLPTLKGPDLTYVPLLVNP